MTESLGCDEGLESLPLARPQGLQLNDRLSLFSIWQIRAALGVVLCLCTSNFAMAIETSPTLAAGRIFDLKSAIAVARENNPTLKQYRETINQATASSDLTRTALFPVLNWNINAGPAQNSTLNVASPLFGGNSYNYYNTNLQLIQPLFVYGSFSAVDSAKFQVDINLKNVELQERSLDSQVIQAFYNVIYNKNLLQWRMETKPVVQKSLDVSTYRYKIGRAQLLDVLQAKTQLANLEPQIEQARAAFEAAGAQLATLLGLENIKSISVRGKMKTLLFKDVVRRVDLKKYYLPELEQNKLQIDQLVKARDVEMGKYWPTVKFTGTYGPTAYSQSDLWNPNAVAWSAYINVTFPLFQGFGSKYDAAVYTSQQLQLMHVRKQLEETIFNNQTTNKTNLDSTEVSLISAVLADKLAEESLQEAIRQYRLATIDFLQFLTIQQTALSTKSQVEQLKYASIAAYANYFVAMGQPLNQLVDLLTEEEGK